METDPKQSWLERFNAWARSSVILKLLTIGLLFLLLLIPVGLIESHISERQNAKGRVVEEVSGTWGQPQELAGPVLCVPVLRQDSSHRMERGMAYFLPNKLSITGTLQPQVRRRSIYQVLLYQAQLHVQGSFVRPNLAALNIKDGFAQWNQAFILFNLTDLRGIKNELVLQLGPEKLSFNPGIPPEAHAMGSTGLTAMLLHPVDSSAWNFSFPLVLNGSAALRLQPLGKTTQVNLSSPWATPSFVGAFLPEERTITTDGFTARWHVLYLNRNYPQQWVDFTTARDVNASTRNRYSQPSYSAESPAESAFGVELLVPLDEYQKTTRAVKYSGLFVLFVFLSFFLVEVLARRRIHPIQYLLVGFGIALFYLLLLSLSEYLPFTWAYLLAGLATWAVNLAYVRSFVGVNKLGLILGAVLLGCYLYFFTLLQLEDYALLIGSIGLLLVLGLVMYLTRRVDWYHAYSSRDN